jgi:hypothetical protein
MSSHTSAKSSTTSSPLESIPENDTGAIDALPPSAYAYASAAKSLHSSASVKTPKLPKGHSESKKKEKKKKTMTAEEQMALLLQFKAEKEMD